MQIALMLGLVGMSSAQAYSSTHSSTSAPSSAPRPARFLFFALMVGFARAQTCSDSCMFAYDGWCDDGGPGSEYSDCTLGTDCGDCGPRSGTTSSPPSASCTSNCLCTNTCSSASDNDCDDGGPGAEYSACSVGTDCVDCGPRTAPVSSPASPPPPHSPPFPPRSPPLVAPPGSTYVCSDTCVSSSPFDNGFSMAMYYAGDSECQDGGPGSEFPFCTFGTDCTDCGPRLVSIPPPPPPQIAPPIVVAGGSWPSECGWSISCTNGYARTLSQNSVPMTVANPNLIAGATCTLILTESYGDTWNGASWTWGDVGPYTISSYYVYSQTFTFTVPLPGPPPAPPALPPVAPIAAGTNGFAMVVPSLIITYQFDNYSVATVPSCAVGCTPTVDNTTAWDSRLTQALRIGTNAIMGCSGRPRCVTSLSLPPEWNTTDAAGISTIHVEVIVKWTDAEIRRTFPPAAPTLPPSEPSHPPPPPPPLPYLESTDMTVDMIATGMGLYHERFLTKSPPPPVSKPPPPTPYADAKVFVQGAELAPAIRKSQLLGYNMTHLSTLLGLVNMTVTRVTTGDDRSAVAIYLPPSSPPSPKPPPSKPPPPLPPVPPFAPPALCVNTCNEKLPGSRGKCDDGAMTEVAIADALAQIRASRNPTQRVDPFAGTTDRTSQVKCDLGTDCDDCGLRSMCTSCPSACSALALNSVEGNTYEKEACLEFMYMDAQCWPQCNTAECGHHHCTSQAAILACLTLELKQGRVYSSMPSDPFAPTGQESKPLVTASFDIGEFRIGVDRLKGAGVQIDFNLKYNLSWRDDRMANSPCRVVLPAMLSSKGSEPSQHLATYWRPKLAIGTETEPARARSTMDSFFKVPNLTETTATALLDIREAVTVSFDFVYTFFPFDHQTIRLDLRLPTVRMNGCQALVDKVRAQEVARGSGILPGNAAWLWESCGTSGGGCDPEKIEKDVFIDAEFLAAQRAGGDAFSGDCPVLFKIRRNNNVFVIKQLVPTIIIAEAPLISLWLDPTIPPVVAGRASIHIFAMVLVVLRASADLGLGVLSSLIWTDEFSLVQFFVIFSGLMETIFVHCLLRFNHKILALSVDGVFRKLLPFVLFPCLVVGWILKGLQETTAFLAVIVGGLSAFTVYSIFLTLRKTWNIEKNRQTMVKALKALKTDDVQKTLTKDQMDKVMRMTFDTFDLDKSKKLEKAEVRLILDAMYPNLNRQQVTEAMKAVKADEIPYEDFAIVVEDWQQIQDQAVRDAPPKRTLLELLGFRKKVKQTFKDAVRKQMVTNAFANGRKITKDPPAKQHETAFDRLRHIKNPKDLVKELAKLATKAEFEERQTLKRSKSTSAKLTFDSPVKSTTIPEPSKPADAAAGFAAGFKKLGRGGPPQTEPQIEC